MNPALAEVCIGSLSSLLLIAQTLAQLSLNLAEAKVALKKKTEMGARKMTKNQSCSKLPEMARK